MTTGAGAVAEWERLLEEAPMSRRRGKVRQVVGLRVEATGLDAPVGALCEIAAETGSVAAEAVGVREGRLVLLPYSDPQGIGAGQAVRLLSLRSYVPAGDGLLGRVIDGAGRPLDGRGPLVASARVPLRAAGRPVVLAFWHGQVFILFSRHKVLNAPHGHLAAITSRSKKRSYARSRLGSAGPLRTWLPRGACCCWVQL